MILIGSRALALRAPQLLSRPPLDYDFVCHETDAYEWLYDHGLHKSPVTQEGNKLIVEEHKIEFDLVTPGSSNEMLLDLAMKCGMATKFGHVPDLDLLFTIKSSHKHKKNSVHFLKTFRDYHTLKVAGATVRPEYQEFFKLREKETYNYAHPKLNQPKKMFFDESVVYTYDHDSIHRAVALQDRPAYTFFSKENEEVFSSKRKFYDQDRKIQLNSVVEESAVLAIERSLVPFPGAMSHKQAWLFAFSKVCTSIASGWWRAFAYDEGPEILNLYPADYWNRFETGLANGVVKRA